MTENVAAEFVPNRTAVAPRKLRPSRTTTVPGAPFVGAKSEMIGSVPVTTNAFGLDAVRLTDTGLELTIGRNDRNGGRLQDLVLVPVPPDRRTDAEAVVAVLRKACH